jgi:flagellar protein FlaG
MSSEMSIRSVANTPVTAPSIVPDAGELRQRAAVGQQSQAVSASLEIQSMKELNDAQRHGESVQISDQQVIRMIEKANKALQLRNTSFEFAVHKQTKQIMVKVFDKDSGEVIREIPPQKVLDMVAKMWELAGLLIDERL